MKNGRKSTDYMFSFSTHVVSGSLLSDLVDIVSSKTIQKQKKKKKQFAEKRRVCMLMMPMMENSPAIT